MTEGTSGTVPERTARELIDEKRAEMLLRVESLTRQLDAIVEASAWTTNDNEHDAEGVTIAFERAQVQGLLNQARNDIEELDRAVGKLADGSYGVCERCGGTIAELRLEALPATRTCITCANSVRR